MKRVLGLLPANEIEITKKFKDSNNLNITIYSGSKGWSILFSSDYVKYEDVKASAEDNFKAAYNVATQISGKLIEI